MLEVGLSTAHPRHQLHKLGERHSLIAGNVEEVGLLEPKGGLEYPGRVVDVNRIHSQPRIALDDDLLAAKHPGEEGRHHHLRLPRAVNEKEAEDDGGEETVVARH